MNGDTLSLFKFDIKMTGTLANGAKKWSRFRTPLGLRDYQYRLTYLQLCVEFVTITIAKCILKYSTLQTIYSALNSSQAAPTPQQPVESKPIVHQHLPSPLPYWHIPHTVDHDTLAIQFHSHYVRRTHPSSLPIQTDAAALNNSNSESCTIVQYRSNERDR